MGFESVPLLVSILSAIWAVVKTIWDFAKQRALMIVTFVSLIIPWIIKFVVKWFSWRYLLWGVIAVLIGQAVTSALNVAREIPRLQAVYQDFVDMFPGVGWFLFEGPMQLHVLLEGIPGMITTWIACTVGIFVVRHVKWIVQLGLANVLKGG